MPPSLLDAEGVPRFGAYRGAPAQVSFGALARSHRPGPLAWWRAHKCWSFVTAATPQVLVGLAVVDLGYASHAFLHALDLVSHEPLVMADVLGLPWLSAHVGERPAEGLEVRFQGGGLRADVLRPAGAPACSVRVELSPTGERPAMRWEGTLVAADTTGLSVIAPVKDGWLNFTHKLAGLPTDGVLEVGDRSWSLDGGTGGSDYSRGLLARHTSWRWAMASGRLPDGTILGFNLAEGFNESGELVENAFWSGGEPLPLPPVRFQRSEEGWRIRSEDGAVDLRFRELHEYHLQRRLLLVRSDFRQAVGVYSGCFRRGQQRIEIDDVVGLAEDQDVLW